MDLPEYQWGAEWITPETPRRIQEQQMQALPPVKPLAPNPLLNVSGSPVTRSVARKPRPAAQTSQAAGNPGTRTSISRRGATDFSTHPVRNRAAEQPRDRLGRFARSGQALLRGVGHFLNGEVKAAGAPTTLKRLPHPAAPALPRAPRARKSRKQAKEPGFLGRVRAVASGEYTRQRRRNARVRAVAQFGELKKPVRRRRRRVPAQTGQVSAATRPRKKRGWLRRFLRRLL